MRIALPQTCTVARVNIKRTAVITLVFFVLFAVANYGWTSNWLLTSIAMAVGVSIVSLIVQAVRAKK